MQVDHNWISIVVFIFLRENAALLFDFFICHLNILEEILLSKQKNNLHRNYRGFIGVTLSPWIGGPMAIYYISPLSIPHYSRNPSRWVFNPHYLHT